MYAGRGDGIRETIIFKQARLWEGAFYLIVSLNRMGEEKKCIYGYVEIWIESRFCGAIVYIFNSNFGGFYYGLGFQFNNYDGFFS